MLTAKLPRPLPRIFRTEGYEVRTTADAEVLIHWVVAWQPALVFVDMVGSADNALAVMALLSEAHSRAGVVLMSGVDRGGIRLAREFGAANGLVHAGILRKPFTRDHVLTALARSPHALESVERVADPLADLSESEFAHALDEAVAGNQLRTVYQPKISCSTGAIVGFEALARWDHPTLGYIPPATFIPHAAAAWPHAADHPSGDGDRACLVGRHASRSVRSTSPSTTPRPSSMTPSNCGNFARTASGMA